MVESDEQSGVNGSNCGIARAEGGSRSIVYHEAASVVLVRWPDDGQSLAGRKLEK